MTGGRCCAQDKRACCEGRVGKKATVSAQLRKLGEEAVSMSLETGLWSKNGSVWDRQKVMENVKEGNKEKVSSEVPAEVCTGKIW